MNSIKGMHVSRLLTGVLALIFSTTFHGLTLTSSAFTNQGFIPNEYACDGRNDVPPLTWKNAPAGTKSFVLIMEDPDALKGPWVHWLLFNIPPQIHALNNTMTKPLGTKDGLNSWGKVGYDGPCPPKGPHHYIFTLYALDKELDLPERVGKEEIFKAMEKHVLTKSSWTGTYRKIIF